MFDHVTIRASDRTASERFYDTVLTELGVDRTYQTGSFSLVAGEPTENLHMAFPSDDDAAIQAFHGAATGAGYRSNGPPGERPQYHPGYYAAYVLDPDGNNVEVVNHHRT